MKHRMRTLARKCWPTIKLVLTAQLIGTAFSILCLLCSGCATGYLGDRCRDGADIFTATVGVGGGAKVRVGPVNCAVPLSFSAKECGLRGGFIIGPDNDSYDMWLLFLGADWFWCKEDDRNKSATVATFGPDGAKLSGGPALYTQIDILLGLGGTVRLGFNPGELLDFILGWTTIDIYSDDVASITRQKEKESNKVPESIGTNAPNSQH